MEIFIVLLIGVTAITGSVIHYLSKEYDSNKYSSNQAFKFLLLGLAGIAWGIILYLTK